MDRRLLTEAGILAAVGAVVIVDSLSYPASLVPGAPGPAFLPRLLASGLLAAAGMLAWRARPGGGSREPDGTPSQPEPEPGEAPSHPPSAPGAGPRVTIAVAAIAGFIAIAPRTHTLIVLPVLVAVLMVLMGERRPIRLLGAPLLFTAFVFVVFVQLFGVSLPGLL
ncbi:MAG: tripartite tricarboxylate transporter TctB family protein [Gemmatimonadota bacterium]|nr:tripartite tricarboxylate transporter TctB family protein [Gemmatimonadota bacterium]